MKRIPNLLAVLCLAPILASCSSSTSTTTPTNGAPLVAANPQSTFTFDVTTTDLSGNPVGATSHVSDTIVETGVPFMGMTNCVHIVGSDDQGQSTGGYYSLLSNGDLALYLGPLRPGIKAQWLTMPFGTGSPVTTTIEDTSIVVVDPQSGAVFETERVQEDATYTHDAGTTLTVQGKSLALDNVRGDYNVKTTVTIVGQSPITTSSPVSPFHYYWSREIGFMAESKYSSVDPMTGAGQTVTMVLSSYTLK